MGFVVSTPSYMYQSPSGYIFRLRVPKDLRAIVGKGEFRYSLRTGALRVAKSRARDIASYLQQLFMRVRSRMSEFTQEQIQALVKNYIRETLANDEKCRAMSGPSASGTATLEGKSLLESSDMKADEARSLLKSVDRWLKYQDHSLMHSVTDKLILSQGGKIEPESETYKVLSRELMKAFQGILNVRIKRSEGDYSKSDEELISVLKQDVVTPTEAPKVSVETVQLVTFSEVQERYVNEVRMAEGWTKKTEAENQAIFGLFVQARGNLPVDQIDRTLMSDYKSSVLMCIPPNMNKLKQYQGMTVEEVIATNPGKTISVNTINKHIRRMSALFNYAVKNGYMESNPAADLQIKNKKRVDQEREAYSREDLIKLFSSEEYTEGTHKQPYGFWTPYIALYSGCRLEEICQLHLDDIRLVGDVWVFDINDKDEKRLKTKSSERLVPIHPELIRLGLLDFVESLKKKKEVRLFPELSQRRDGYGQTVSKWFARYKTRCGIGEGKTFHSFRHTFITHLKHKQVDPFMIHELDGHAIDSETMGRYGKRFTPEILLREAIEKIDYSFQLPFKIR